MSRFLLSSLCVAVLAASARADLPAEGDLPYHLTVALRLADHPVFKGVFKEQIKGELHDWLQGALGDMGEVDVIDMADQEAVARDPLLKEVAAQGLKALDTWKGMSDHKTHFVLIDFVRGRYEIQARQYDGLTGLSSPVVRKVWTFDRQFVARTAAQVIDRDFGLVGTIDPGDQKPDIHEVHVNLKGGRLGVPLDLKTGDLFALAQVNKGRGGEAWSFRVPWALLQVIDGPAEGVCRCRLYFRFLEPLKTSAGILGYRCLKLGTTAAPLRLRLVDDQTLLGVPSQQVTISPYGFDSKNRAEAVTNWDGLVQTDDKTYDNIAFVRVLSGERVRAQVPVEVLGDGLLTCPISRASGESDVVAELEERKKRLVQELFDALALARQLFKELGDIKAQEAARDRAAAGEKELADEIAARSAELSGLQTAVQEAKAAKQVDLAGAKLLLDDLKDRQAKVQEFKNRVEEVLKQAPLHAKWATMVQQAQLLEDQADYDKALDLYEQVLKELPEADKPKLQKTVDDLRKAWKPANLTGEQRDARAVICDVWTKADSTKELKEDLPKVQSAFEVLKKAGDKLALRKLLLADIPHAAFLKKRIEELKSQNTEDAREEIKAIAEVGGGLEKLHKEVSAYVQPGKAAG